MIALDALLEQVGALDAAELERWIASGWVRPDGERGRWQFHEVDVARVRLIVEIHRELAIDEDSVPVVLSLLDQLYGLRRELNALCGAIGRQPDTVRQAIATALKASRGPDEAA